MALDAHSDLALAEAERRKSTSPWPAKRPLLLMLALMAATLAAAFLLPPVPQDQHYHLFVDTRRVLGIPNAWNVLSNIPFVVIGAAGLFWFRSPTTAAVLFLGVFLTGFGSAYYHWEPNDGTLFWDRLPMTIGFMAILAGTIEERVDARAGAIALWPLLGLGLFSLLLWRWTDDLRLYGWVQFFPLLALLLIFLLVPPRFSGTWWWLVAVVLYLLAKVFEHFDAEIYSLTNFVSGHTLKHLAAAAACLAILLHFRFRVPLKP